MTCLTLVAACVRPAKASTNSLFQGPDEVDFIKSTVRVLWHVDLDLADKLLIAGCPCRRIPRCRQKSHDGVAASWMELKLFTCYLQILNVNPLRP